MRPAARDRRPAVAAVAATLALASSILWPSEERAAVPRPNVIVVLTDDQAWDTLDAMPWLSEQLADPGSSWVSVPLAFANTPLCCPARASLLTGLYSRHTGVLDNEDGGKLDESDTLATWLHGAGYRTGLVGKYLNRYPFGRLPYLPPGWDRFVAKRNLGSETVYRDFDVVDQTSPLRIRGVYATDWLADEAVRFVRTTSTEQPFFLLFAPSAPHEPWAPAPRHEGAYASRPEVEAPNVMGALRGAPPWVRARRVPGAAQRAEWLDIRRRADETLLAVDEAIRSIVGALGDRVDETFVFVLSDNGYSWGEHRWEGKRCPYEACVRVPMVVHTPARVSLPPTLLASMVDLAPTIASLAGVRAGEVDGVDLSPWLVPDAERAAGHPPGAVLMEWAGDPEPAPGIPAWVAVRTVDFKLIRYEDGTEELYDLEGRLGRPDPHEMTNRVNDPSYAATLDRLRRLLGRL